MPVNSVGLRWMQRRGGRTIEHFGIYPDTVVSRWPKNSGMRARGEPECHELRELGGGLTEYFSRVAGEVALDERHAPRPVDPRDAVGEPKQVESVMTLTELWATLLYSNYDLEAENLGGDSSARIGVSVQDPPPRLDHVGISRVRKALSLLPGRAVLAFERGLLFAASWLSSFPQGETLSLLERLGILARGEVYLSKFVDGDVRLPDPSLSESGAALLEMSSGLGAGVDGLIESPPPASDVLESYGESLPCVDPLASSLALPYSDGRRLVSARIMRSGFEQFVVLRSKSRVEAAARVASYVKKMKAESAVWVIQENPWIAYASGAVLHMVSPSLDESSLQTMLWPGYEDDSPTYRLVG